VKRLIFIAMLLFVTAFLAHTQQYCPESDFMVAPVNNGLSVRIVEYLGSNQTVRIPSRIRNLPVTHIGELAFWGRSLICVTLPDSVVHIGTSAFAGNQLASITIPDSVTEIWLWAFAGNQLANVIIGNGVMQIQSHAFYRNQLTNIAIPNNVLIIGSSAFRGNLLTSVAVPNRTDLGFTPVFDPSVEVIRN